jgi:hypothetical protein
MSVTANFRQREFSDDGYNGLITVHFFSGNDGLFRASLSSDEGAKHVLGASACGAVPDLIAGWSV